MNATFCHFQKFFSQFNSSADIIYTFAYLIPEIIKYFQCVSYTSTYLDILIAK